MQSQAVKEISETEDPYVAVSLARAQAAKVLTEVISSRVSHFTAIHRIWEPGFYQLIQLATSMAIISPDLAERLCRMEDIFHDRNSKQLDLESRDYFPPADQSELSKHEGFDTLDAKHVFIVWLFYTLNDLADETSLADYQPFEDC